MAKQVGGDYRNFAEIRAWASGIAGAIGAGVASRTG